MRRSALVILLVLLAGCTGHGASEVAAFGEPGLNVATAALQGGSPQLALQVADHMLEKTAGNEAALVVQGDALTALGRGSEARVSYTKALNVNPQSAGALIGMGRLNLATDPRASEHYFLQALDHDPRNTTALNDLGVARDLQGNHTGAQEAYAHALGIKPDLMSAEVNLALSLGMSGDSHRAVQLMRPLATEPGASAQMRQNFAAVLTMAGDRATAARILSPDMSPEDVQRALDAYAAAGSGSMTPLVDAAPQQASQPAMTTIQPAAAPVPRRAPSPAAAPASAPPPARSSIPGRIQGVAAAPVPVPPAGWQLSAAAPGSVSDPALSPATSSQASVQAPPPAAARSPSAATGSVSASATAPSSGSPGRVQVQFAAAPTQHAARADWHRLQNLMPTLLSDRVPEIVRVELHGRIFWRLRTGGFADVGQAADFCRRVRAAGNDCVIGGA